MTSLPPIRHAFHPRTRLRPVLYAVLAALFVLAPPARAQISFSTAVSLALNDSPKVRMAQDDVVKARAALAQTRDVYIPAVQGVMDLGYSYGAPLGEPTLFSFSASSLVFDYSQKDYTRSARSGLTAANLALTGARQQVAQDAAVTYIHLDRDLQSHAALLQQLGYANRLVAIVQDRLSAGQDSRIDLITARRTAVQIHLQMLTLDDEIDSLSNHLSRLDGLPAGPIATVAATIPPLPPLPPDSTTADDSSTPSAPLADTPSVAAAFANARAKEQQAFGDARYLYRPQISFFAQYSRFSTFNNYQTYYPAFSSNTLNAIGIGVQISIPFYDRAHQDKALQSSAVAAHAHQEAIQARQDLFEGRLKLRHSSAELADRATLADLDQQIAQQQLDAVLIQIKNGTGNPNAPQPSPKDEEKARIQERQRFIDVLNASFQLDQARIELLREDGDLDTWIKAATAPATSGTPPLDPVTTQLNPR